VRVPALGPLRCPVGAASPPRRGRADAAGAVRPAQRRSGVPVAPVAHRADA